MPLQTLKPQVKTMAPTGPKSVSQTTRIRGSALQKIRREKLLKNPACEVCAKQGIVTPATEVDHITPLWAGGAESDANRCSICQSCHLSKSAREAKARASGGALQE
jgi:5-methylcytosine-specific restriction protein A